MKKALFAELMRSTRQTLNHAKGVKRKRPLKVRRVKAKRAK